MATVFERVRQLVLEKSSKVKGAEQIQPNSSFVDGLESFDLLKGFSSLDKGSGFAKISCT